MTSSDLIDRLRRQRTEFWQGVGTVGATRDGHGDLDEPSLWPTRAASYLHVRTAHSGIVTTDGLSDLPADPGAGPRGPGVELYVEGVDLLPEEPTSGRWLVDALAEAAGAVAGARSGIRDALADHDLLSMELSGRGAPEEWVADGRLGVLLGVRLPGRSTGFDLDGERVHVLSLTPIRPEELAVVTAEGTAGRTRVAAALADSGWYSYADAERPSVL